MRVGQSVCPSDLNLFLPSSIPLCVKRGDPTRWRNPPAPWSHRALARDKLINQCVSTRLKAGPRSIDKEGEKDDASLRTSECDYGVVASHPSGRRQTFQLSRPEMPDCLESVEPDPSLANDRDLLNRVSQSSHRRRS